MSVRSDKAQAAGRRAGQQTSARQTRYKWRRLHDGNIIAEVTPHSGMGFWRASAYRVDGRASEVAYTGRAFLLLNEAHQAADELVQREFHHECRTGVCGRWLRWALTEEDRVLP
jgi:hypothetical protein